MVPVLAKIGNGGPLHSQWNSFESPEKYMKYLYQLAKLFTVHITEEFTKLFRDEDGWDVPPYCQPSAHDIENIFPAFW